MTLPIEYPKVVIARGNSPEETLSNAFSKFGEMTSIIKEGEDACILINMEGFYGFPAMVNLQTLKSLIDIVKQAGAHKISIGVLNRENIPIKLALDYRGLINFFNELKVEILYLDNSNYYIGERNKVEELKIIKERDFNVETKENVQYLLPREIVKNNHLIILNQVGVHPIFVLNLSILRFLDFSVKKSSHMQKEKKNRIEYCRSDEYEKELIKTILHNYSFLKPALVINDLFYMQESAGPCIYKDSNLKKTNTMVIGNNPLATDQVTMSLLGVDPENHVIIREAKHLGLIKYSFDSLNVIGENLEGMKREINKCAKLKEIGVLNLYLRQGQLCSGCSEKAYHFLNLLKTYMLKDLKYIKKNWFFMGESPPDLEKAENPIILFGDCAIESTKRYAFRKISKVSKKKMKVKKNKKIIELNGCPPSISDCLIKLKDYYGKGNLPSIHSYLKMLKSIKFFEAKKKLDAWREL